MQSGCRGDTGGRCLSLSPIVDDGGAVTGQNKGRSHLRAAHPRDPRPSLCALRVWVSKQHPLTRATSPLGLLGECKVSLACERFKVHTELGECPRKRDHVCLSGPHCRHTILCGGVLLHPVTNEPVGVLHLFRMSLMTLSFPCAHLFSTLASSPLVHLKTHLLNIYEQRPAVSLLEVHLDTPNLQQRSWGIWPPGSVPVVEWGIHPESGDTW